MAHLFFLQILIFTSLCSCEQRNVVSTQHDIACKTNNDIDSTPGTKLYYDTSVIAILPPDKSHPWLFKDAKPATLANGEISNTEKLLLDCISLHNAKQDVTKEFSAFIDLKKYKRQYIPFINPAGEKIIFVNCFCTAGWEFRDWKKVLVQVDDGGYCFFQLTINLTKLEFSQFAVNGYG